MAPAFLARVQKRNLQSKANYRKKGVYEVFRHPGPTWGLRRTCLYSPCEPGDKYPWMELKTIPQGFFEQVYEDGHGTHWDRKKRVRVDATVPMQYGSACDMKDLKLKALVTQLDNDGAPIPGWASCHMLLINERSACFD